MEKNRFDGENRCKHFFYETLEVITNGVPKLANNANNAQRITHKEAVHRCFW